MLIDEPRDFARDWQEIRKRSTMQHEQHQLLRVGAWRAAAGCGNLAEFEPVGALRDRFDVVREVILAVDENDFLGASCDDQFAFVREAKIAGPQPAVGGKESRIRFRGAVVAGGDIVTADLDVTDAIGGDRLIGVVHEPQFGVGDGTAHLHQRERVRIACGPHVDPVADAKVVTLDADAAVRAAGHRDRHADRGLREPVDRVHRISRQSGWRQAIHELVAQFDADRLSPIEDQSYG